MEGAKIKEIAAENIAMQKIELLESQKQESIMQGIKESLLSLQKEIASCLIKLDLGWGNKEKGIQQGPVEEGKGLKDWESKGEKEVGPGLAQPKQVMDPVDQPTRQQIINRYLCV
jgi:hypothetical protein